MLFERFKLRLEIAEALCGRDLLHSRAVRGKSFGDGIEVEAELFADFGVDRCGAVVERDDRGGRRVFAFGEDGSDHICGLTAEVCVIDAVAEERAVEGEGIGARCSAGCLRQQRSRK